MSRRDGTGPAGKGSMTGRGLGNCKPAENTTDETKFLGRGRGSRNSLSGCGRGCGNGFGRGNGYGSQQDANQR